MDKFRVYNASGNYTTFNNEKTAFQDYEKKREEALKLARKNGDWSSYGRIKMINENDTMKGVKWHI